VIVEASEREDPEIELGLRAVGGTSSRRLRSDGDPPLFSSLPEDCPICDGLRRRVLKVLRPAAPLSSENPEE
jgi:hypothetical protein